VELTGSQGAINLAIQQRSQPVARESVRSQQGYRKSAWSQGASKEPWLGEGVREPAGISTEPGSLGARELARSDGASNDYMELGSLGSSKDVGSQKTSNKPWIYHGAK